MTTIQQREYNTPNLQKSCQRGSFKLETNWPFHASDGSLIVSGTPVKLFCPRNTFAVGLTIDGKKFVARAEWIAHKAEAPCKS